MSNIRFSHDWLPAGGGAPFSRETTAQFALYVDDVCLTRNEDIWSKTTRDSVLISTYPLAMWLAYSWWRLNWEPLPRPHAQPSLDWRMAHELGAANHGFVWPRVLFASDGEFINVWAEAAKTDGQSVSYLGGLEAPRSISVSQFQQSVDGFICAVLNRLRAVGLHDTELAGLWNLVLEDRADPSMARMRCLEAQMGFDPEECPDNVLRQALTLQKKTGDSAMSELAPVFGRRGEGASIFEIENLGAAPGLRGKPEIEPSNIDPIGSTQAPWQRGVDAARKLRAHINNTDGAINNATLLGLLGLTESQVEDWSVPTRSPVAVATPAGCGYFNYVLRKRHPLGRRFEFSRLLGDHLHEPEGSAYWLTSTDLATARQKYQRAFAAEFLCPLQSLVNFLGGDFSESALEESADHFDVSGQTVESLLINNGYLSSPYYGSNMPYGLAA